MGLCLYSVLLTEWTNDCQRVENIPMNVRVEELVHLVNSVPQSPQGLQGYKGKHLPKEYIERREIYFGFEVDEKLLPFAIEEFGDQCWVYGSDIPHGDRLYGAVDVFLKRDDISEESKRKLLGDNTVRFYGLEKLET